MKKKTTEFFEIIINGKCKVIAIKRDKANFDNIAMESGESTKLWYKYINNIIEDMFNLNMWTYLGNEETYVNNNNETIIFIEYKKYNKN